MRLGKVVVTGIGFRVGGCGGSGVGRRVSV
jgi:hypothetical protein